MLSVILKHPRIYPSEYNLPPDTTLPLQTPQHFLPRPESDLMAVILEKDRNDFSLWLIYLGKAIGKANQAGT
jgi:hypothetical protein